MYRGGRHRATGLWPCTTLRNQILRHRFAIPGSRGLWAAVQHSIQEQPPRRRRHSAPSGEFMGSKAELANFPNRAGREDSHGQAAVVRCKSNDVRFEAKDLLFRALGVDLTLIEGNRKRERLGGYLAEVGVDVSRFPTESISRVGYGYVRPR